MISDLSGPGLNWCTWVLQFLLVIWSLTFVELDKRISLLAWSLSNSSCPLHHWSVKRFTPDPFAFWCFMNLIAIGRVRNGLYHPLSISIYISIRVMFSDLYLYPFTFGLGLVYSGSGRILNESSHIKLLIRVHDLVFLLHGFPQVLQKIRNTNGSFAIVAP